jgi:hypothetical protein
MHYFRTNFQAMPAASKPATDKVLHYIENLPEWSRTLCTELRQIILSDDLSLQEEWKWGPHYSSKGMVCGYGAYQQHVKFTFFNGSAMKDPAGIFNHCTDNSFSRSIKFTPDTPIDGPLLSVYIKESVLLNEKGFKRVIQDKTVAVPEALMQALQQNARAFSFFDSLSYGYKKDFAQHVATAKLEKTRAERITKIVALCEAGKTMNHKYK